MGQPESKRQATGPLGLPPVQAAPFENYQPPGNPPPQSGYVQVDFSSQQGPGGVDRRGPRLVRYPADQSVLSAPCDFPPPARGQRQLPRRADFPFSDPGPDNIRGRGDNFWADDDDGHVGVPPGPRPRGPRQFDPFMDGGAPSNRPRLYDPFNDGLGPGGRPRQGFMQNFAGPDMMQGMGQQMNQQRAQLQHQQQQRQQRQQQGYRSPTGPVQPKDRKITRYVYESPEVLQPTGAYITPQVVPGLPQGSAAQQVPQVIQDVPQTITTQQVPQAQTGASQPMILYYDPATGAVTAQQQPQQPQQQQTVQQGATYPQVAPGQAAQQPLTMQQMFGYSQFPFSMAQQQQAQQQQAQPIVIPGSIYTPNNGVQSFGGYQPQT